MTTPGDFTKLKMKAGLADAYNAVTSANGWDWMKQPETPGNGGFILYIHPMIFNIFGFMKVHHTNASLAEVMMHMKSIAKDGWDNYVKTTNPIDEASI